MRYLNFLIPVVVKTFIPDGRFGVITVITDLVILPAALWILNLYIVAKSPGTRVAVCSLFIGIGLVSGDLAGYTIWGISNRQWFHPDAETIWILSRLVVYHCVVGILFGFVVVVSRRLFKSQ